jgi:hypothetical protein
MERETLQAFLRLGVLLAGCSFVMLFMQPPDSAEFVVSACTTAMGLTLIAGVIVLTRWWQGRP